MAKDRFDIKEKEGLSLMTDAVVIIDKETGVNYLFVCRGYGGGLTPLIDADGKPIVTKDSLTFLQQRPLPSGEIEGGSPWRRCPHGQALHGTQSQRG